MKLFATVLLLFLAAGVLRSEGAPTAGFSKLSDALAFIDACLDQDDWRKLELALYPPYEKDQPSRASWVHLKAVRKDRKLTDILRQHEFPADQDKFSIGYCRSGPLPHAHMDFMKHGNSWKLHAIWVCR